MRHSISHRRKAISLRKLGYSLNEISKIMSISKSTASVWLRDVRLSTKAKKRLEDRKMLGYYKTQMIRKKRRSKILMRNMSEAREIISQVKFEKPQMRVLCAILYWAEGSKTYDTSIKFTNSNPKMIKVFINTLRRSYKTDPKKFRALLHLHEYHKEKKQKNYWSRVTGIPLSQFTKSYLKPNTKKRIRADYPGCIVVTYYDASIAKKIKAMYNSLADYLGA